MKSMNLPKPTGEYAVGTFVYTVWNDREEVMHQGACAVSPHGYTTLS